MNIYNVTFIGFDDNILMSVDVSCEWSHEAIKAAFVKLQAKHGDNYVFKLNEKTETIKVWFYKSK